MDDARLSIGGNNPPTDFEEVSDEIESLYIEAKNFCDGDAIETPEQADKIGLIVQSMRKAITRADNMRKQEVKPLDLQKKAIQAKYAPLIAQTKEVTGKAHLAIDACRAALAPWLAKVEEQKRIEDEKRQREAEEAKQAAQAELDSARAAADLEAREKADALLKEAEKQQKAANKAAKAKVLATGGAGRAIGFRDNWTAEITDLNAAINNYWKTDKSEFQALVQELANRDAKQGRRNVPGIEFKNERVAR